MQRALGGDTGAILTPAMARVMIAPTNSTRMGLGWALQRFGNATYLSHGGIRRGRGRRSLYPVGMLMGRILWDYMVEVLGGKPACAEKNEQDTFGISMTRGAG